MHVHLELKPVLDTKKITTFKLIHLPILLMEFNLEKYQISISTLLKEIIYLRNKTQIGY